MLRFCTPTQNRWLRNFKKVMKILNFDKKNCAKIDQKIEFTGIMSCNFFDYSIIMTQAGVSGFLLFARISVCLSVSWCLNR